jgi:predicted Zn-dependent peptidase
MQENLPSGASIETAPGYPPVVSYTLKNGLKLLVLEKNFAPTISFSLAFRAGSVDCPPGKTGLAHLFEHMAFKGTETINTRDYAGEKAALDKVERAAAALIAAKGGQAQDRARVAVLEREMAAAEEEADAFVVMDEYSQIYRGLGQYGLNAGTAQDYTFYVVSLPANRLEAWMAIESERFARPVLREFYRERSVVMEEQRMYAAQPDRALMDRLMSEALTAHPYRTPIGGLMEDIERLTRTDAEKFYREFYVPNNAAMAVVGDVRPAEVIRLAEKYFAGWEPRPLPAADYPREPEQAAEKRFAMPFNAEPSLRMAFHNPGYGSPDIYPLIMASEVLSGGKTGRFYRNLVEGRQLALYAFSEHATGTRYPSLFVIAAAPRAPHTAEELEGAVWEELAALAARPPSAWELEKIVNNREAEMVKNLEAGLETAQILSLSQQVCGDWRFDWKVTEALRAVKPADVSAAAARYLTRRNCTIGVISRPAGGPK